jgi:hypothetical protein
MKIDFKGLLEGAWNSVFVKDSIEKVHHERIEICRKCPFNSIIMKEENGYKSYRPDFHCTICGCNLDMKTRCMACECPTHKWEALVTEEQEKEIITKLDNKT